MKSEVRLKIADIIIQMQSRFALLQPTKEERERLHSERFNNFFYKGKGKPEILIKVNIVKNFPKAVGARPVFITTHFQGGEEDWSLLKKGDSYIYECHLHDRKQVVFVDKTFERADAYLFFQETNGWSWGMGGIVYDFLQILLINYLSLHNKGIFVHGVGVKDKNAKGLLFAGKSGAGKSTSARLWHRYSNAMVLNDDRIIVRKYADKFFIYGSCWHGEFNDYLDTRIQPAPLEKLFFIYHATRNTAKKIPAKRAFSLLYTNLFPAFWDKKSLGNIASFAKDLVSAVPCYRLGFVNNKRIIPFVRKI